MEPGAAVEPARDRARPRAARARRRGRSPSSARRPAPTSATTTPVVPVHDRPDELDAARLEQRPRERARRVVGLLGDAAGAAQPSSTDPRRRRSPPGRRWRAASRPGCRRRERAARAVRTITSSSRSPRVQITRPPYNRGMDRESQSGRLRSFVIGGLRRRLRGAGRRAPQTPAPAADPAGPRGLRGRALLPRDPRARERVAASRPAILRAHADLRVPVPERARVRAVPAIGDPQPEECEVCGEGPLERVLYPGSGALQGLGLLLDRLRPRRPARSAVEGRRELARRRAGEAEGREEKKAAEAEALPQAARAGSCPRSAPAAAAPTCRAPSGSPSRCPRSA